MNCVLGVGHQIHNMRFQMIINYLTHGFWDTTIAQNDGSPMWFVKVLMYPWQCIHSGYTGIFGTDKIPQVLRNNHFTVCFIHQLIEILVEPVNEGWRNFSVTKILRHMFSYISLSIRTIFPPLSDAFIVISEFFFKALRAKFCSGLKFLWHYHFSYFLFPSLFVSQIVPKQDFDLVVEMYWTFSWIFLVAVELHLRLLHYPPLHPNQLPMECHFPAAAGSGLKLPWTQLLWGWVQLLPLFCLSWVHTFK